jgi:hypothetical protein
MVLCFALPPSCVLVESIIASVYAIPANRDRIRALGLAIRLSCTIIEHGRTVTVFPKSHRKFLRTVFSNRKFLSVVHSINDFLFSLFSPCSRARKQRRSGVGPPRKVAVNQSGFLRKGVLPMKENAIRQIVKKSFWRIRIQLTGKRIFYMVSKVMAVSDTESASQYRRWNSAMVNPTIKLKTPKRTEFGSKPVHAKIT